MNGSGAYDQPSAQYRIDFGDPHAKPARAAHDRRILRRDAHTRRLLAILDPALTDNLALSAEATRLTAELAAARLDRANLLAAIRAALAAARDGEPTPCTTSGTN